MPDRSRHPDFPSQPATTARRTLGWMALGYVALMAYGSFVPFNFRPLSGPEFQQSLHRMRELWFVVSRIDLVANVMLGLPLGYLLLGMWSVDRRRGAAWVGLLLMLPVCLMVSTLVEVGQAFFPPRTPSLNDVIAQLLGACAGGLLWIAAGQEITQRCRELWRWRRHAGLASRWLPLYGLILVVVQLLPLDLAVSPSELWEKWKAGGIQLLPTFAGETISFDRVRSLFGSVAYFVPLGFLWTLARPERTSPWRALGFGLSMAALLEGMQLFIASRTVSSSDVLLGGLGTLLGFAVASVYRRDHEGSQVSGIRRRFGAVTALVAWLGVLVVNHWYPFRFQWEGLAAGQRLSQLSWVPLADYVAQPWAHALDELVERLSLFAVLGGLAALACPESVREANLLVLMGVLVVAVLLEAGQLFLPMRNASLSDVLLELIGGGLGLFVVRQWALAGAIFASSATSSNAAEGPPCRRG